MERRVLYTKLREGTWGIKCRGEVLRPGEIVFVHRRDGKGDLVRVGVLLWVSGDSSLATAVRIMQADEATWKAEQEKKKKSAGVDPTHSGAT